MSDKNMNIRNTISYIWLYHAIGGKTNIHNAVYKRFLIHNVFADKSSVLTNGLIKYLEPKEAYYGIKHKNKDIRNIDNAEVFHNPKSI